MYVYGECLWKSRTVDLCSPESTLERIVIVTKSRYLENVLESHRERNVNRYTVGGTQASRYAPRDAEYAAWSAEPDPVALPHATLERCERLWELLGVDELDRLDFA